MIFTFHARAGSVPVLERSINVGALFRFDRFREKRDSSKNVDSSSKIRFERATAAFANSTGGAIKNSGLYIFFFFKLMYSSFV